MDKPWLREKDSYLWRESTTRYVCQILRRNGLKHLCGYVVLPPHHSLGGLHYDDLQEQIDYVPHGSLTFSRTYAKTGYTKVGFDCAHLGDLVPSMADFGVKTRCTYRDAAYVRDECERLARSLKKKE